MLAFCRSGTRSITTWALGEAAAGRDRMELVRLAAAPATTSRPVLLAMIPYVRDIKFEYGKVDQVSPLIRRVIANNPGPFTFTGTGTYIIGKGEGVAVIDPGPDHARAPAGDPGRDRRARRSATS